MKEARFRQTLKTLPICEVFPSLETHWKDGCNRFVLQAEPGAGKSTGIPLFLLQSGLSRGKIIMLEPRRMAARSLAGYLSQVLEDPVGGLVGYRVRGERRCSHRTQLEIVTEGVFIRMVQDDPELGGTAVVILDEFHERNIFSDLAYAFLLDIQENLRSDLKVLIMSATPQKGLLKERLTGAVYLESEGRMFPVELSYKKSPKDLWINPPQIGRAVLQGLNERPGDILVFLPGEGEIHRVEKYLRDLTELADCTILPLYGRLSFRDQEKAFQASPSRKIILATSIAETSLTIPGVTTVVDTGLERRPVFNRHSGMTKLETCRISRASADQRMGRAGRVQEGFCIRLWAEEDHLSMDAFRDPEILTADLSSLVLETALWGCRNPEDLNWLELPSRGHFYQARELLVMLGALREKAGLTAIGKEMVSLGLPPRLARLVVEGRRRGMEQTAYCLAAFLSERDWMGKQGDSDLLLRIDALKRGREGHHPVVRGIQQVWTSLAKGKRNPDLVEPETAGELLLKVYADRIGRQRSGLAYHLSGGGSCCLSESDSLQGTEFLLAVETGGTGQEPRVFLGLGLTKALINQVCGDLITESEEVWWDEDKNRLKSKRLRVLGSLILDETALSEPSSAVSLRGLENTLRKKGLLILPWQKEDLQYWHRCRFAAAPGGNPLWKQWPDFREEALIGTLDAWFAPLLIKGHLAGPLKEGLASLLTWDQQNSLKKLVPERIVVPSGSRVRIDYSDPLQPVLDVRIQEVFGLTETPLIAGTVPLLIRLLNPAGRPIQVTKDLRSFWENTYPEVRKELRGRYTKHYWPENPYDAVPTNRVRPPR